MPSRRQRYAVVPVAAWLLALAGCDLGNPLANSSSPAKLPTVSIADDSPRTYIERSIEACGGQQNIARLQIGRVEMAGRGAFAPGVSGEFTVIDTFDLPRRLRREASFNDGKIALKMVTVVDGDRGWTKAYGDGSANGEVREIPSPSGKNNAFPHSVLGSLVEMRDPAIMLRRVASGASGQTWIAVERDGQPVGTNVFDDQTHRILGCVKQISDPSLGPIEIRTVYSDYRNVGGIDVPMQMGSYRGNDLIMELKVVRLDILPSVDPQLFTRPN